MQCGRAKDGTTTLCLFCQQCAYIDSSLGIQLLLTKCDRMDE
jgi:hypothetical protein